MYLAAERNVEERSESTKLVLQLKQKREAEPRLYHFIKTGKILSRRQSNVTDMPRFKFESLICFVFKRLYTLINFLE